MRPTQTRFFLGLAITVLASSCASCTGREINLGPAGQSGGSGEVRERGITTTWHVVVDESRLLVAVPKERSPVCSVFHSHVFGADSVQYEFLVDVDNPSRSSVVARVAAAGLSVDQPENRAVFPEFTDADPPITDQNRADIRVSMFDQLKAEQHPTLVFTARDLTTARGEGSANVDVELAGAKSTITMQYRSERTLDRFRVTGRGVIDGRQHDIPRGALADCIGKDMPLDLILVLAPGEGPQANVPDASIPVFEQTFFPDDAQCDAQVGFNQVRDVLVRRCAGCHLEQPRLGASVPLVTWHDFRVDSARNQGRPLYQTVRDFLLADPARGELRMPPPDVTQLTEEELSTAISWIDRGGHERRCEETAPTTFQPVEMAPCGEDVTFDDVAPIVERNCLGCHDGSVPGLPLLQQYSDGLQPVRHAFYRPLLIWEAAIPRIEDGSMPPHQQTGIWTGDREADLALWRRWVQAGYPQRRCASGG